jgi:UDP-glucuronate 4-epimerase
MKMVTTLERLLDTEAIKVTKSMQSVDVPSTYADISAVQRDFNWAPTTDLETGLARFVEWWHDDARVSNA